LAGAPQARVVDVTAANITNTRILFAPGNMLKNMLKTLTFEKA